MQRHPGSETILVVEDELPLRELVRDLLVSFGNTVLEAESRVKALAIWRRNKRKICLLLTDLIMPDEPNGRELARKLQKENPKLRVIFTSGYSADAAGGEFISKRGLNYLQKPYNPEKLAQTVRECLDA